MGSGRRLLLYGEPVQRVFFCLRRGEGRESLGGYATGSPPSAYLATHVFPFYDDRDFQGARATTREECRGPPRLGVRQKRGHTWNNRISSSRAVTKSKKPLSAPTLIGFFPMSFAALQAYALSPSRFGRMENLMTASAEEEVLVTVGENSRLRCRQSCRRGKNALLQLLATKNGRLSGPRQKLAPVRVE